MKTAVVTTTIYRPDNLQRWAESLAPGDVIVVAGDRKTPHAETTELLDQIEREHDVTTIYVLEGEHDWQVSDIIGWNTIQRRNVAILEALTYSPDTVITVDTDNYPVRPRTHVAEVNELLHSEYVEPLLVSSTEWFNVGHLLHPKVVHRGFPLSRRHEHADTTWSARLMPRRIGVHTSLWFGDPDVDAIERIHSDPMITHSTTELRAALDDSTWCPFNSQATAWRRELLPLLNVWPFVGRMDDIWSSYVARRVMDHLDYHVAYGRPYVVQERHPHNLVRDLENELLGYRHTDGLTDELRSLDLGDTTDPLDCHDALTTRLAELPFIPPQLCEFWRAWSADVRRAQSIARYSEGE